jgi:ubiquinone/menaquinone biosynthesis C-methylase UbiE
MTNNTKVNWGSEIDKQFIRQAKWTKMFRNQIYHQIKLSKAKRILDAGCGTGVITKEIREKYSAVITAVDKDSSMIEIAKEKVSNVDFRVEDVEYLSMKRNTFDVVITQYLFLWLKNPEKAIDEMARVCKKNGFVVALAEPDYGGWIEYPDMGLGKMHLKSLEKEGADPLIGRKLKYLFESAGLETTISVIAQVWDKKSLSDNIEEEWKRVLEAGMISQKEFKEKIIEEKQAIKDNKRIIFIPVFTAIGKK